MSKADIAKAISQLCTLMQSTDCNELVMEVGMQGGPTDGARFPIHVMRQCPELAAAEEEGEE